MSLACGASRSTYCREAGYEVTELGLFILDYDSLVHSLCELSNDVLSCTQSDY
jgi:hypothetical protein